MPSHNLASSSRLLQVQPISSVAPGQFTILLQISSDPIMTFGEPGHATSGESTASTTSLSDEPVGSSTPNWVAFKGGSNRGLGEAVVELEEFGLSQDGRVEKVCNSGPFVTRGGAVTVCWTVDATVVVVVDAVVAEGADIVDIVTAVVLLVSSLASIFSDAFETEDPTAAVVLVADKVVAIWVVTGTELDEEAKVDVGVGTADVDDEAVDAAVVGAVGNDTKVVAGSSDDITTGTVIKESAALLANVLAADTLLDDEESVVIIGEVWDMVDVWDSSSMVLDTSRTTCLSVTSAVEGNKPAVVEAICWAPAIAPPPESGVVQALVDAIELTVALLTETWQDMRQETMAYDQQNVTYSELR